ncbi:MAG: Nramp family divalent metal transporter [Candidatus Eremiobacteraeota bacterium]|nr:Nramp family divalent metal transporter [Candidatus Eremiobacteraeota bacterium]
MSVAQTGRKRSVLRSLLFVFAILGPGFVTASAGNDVGGITTYSQAGAQFGYRLLWVLIPLAISLIVVQEMATRMGTVTGKGLASLIRENFGVRVSFFAMAGLFVVNLALTASEFAGIATASEIFNVSRYIAVPIAVVAVFLFILRVQNKIVERVFVIFSLIYVSYIASAIYAHPNWSQVSKGLLLPTFDLHNAGYLVMIVALIGTTISPYMQFFLQSAVVEKGTRIAELTLARIDVTTGSVLAIALAGFMIVASGASIFVAEQHGAKFGSFSEAADFAIALKPLAGPFAATIFALGILNAGLFTATILPLSTSYVICEALGFEAAVDRRFKEAPVFFTLFGISLVVGAALVLLPGIPLLKFIFYAQVFQGILLPPELVLMLIIINKTSVMGVHTNSRLANIIAWSTASIIGLLASGYAIQQLFNGGN